MYRQVLIVLDCRRAAWSAVTDGLALASANGAQVLFVFVPPRNPLPLADMHPVPMMANESFDDEVRRRGSQLQARALAAAKAAGLSARHVAVDGASPAPAIARLAAEEGCDAVVVSCEPGNALLRLVTGSLVPGLVTSSPVPVVICHDRPAMPPARQRRTRQRHRRAMTARDTIPPQAAPKLRPS
jgi:nucleotide-binding universal stress UspA family protein